MPNLSKPHSFHYQDSTLNFWFSGMHVSAMLIQPAKFIRNLFYEWFQNQVCMMFTRHVLQATIAMLSSSSHAGASMVEAS
jgi:hypothetical protein